MPYRTREEKRDYARAWWERNKHKQRANSNRWNHTHTDERRRNNRRKLITSRADALTRLGAICLACGITDADVLQIEHAHGDGYLQRETHRREGTGGGTAYYNAVAAYSDAEIERRGLQLLCANCHVKKTRQMGEYRQSSVRSADRRREYEKAHTDPQGSLF